MIFQKDAEVYGADDKSVGRVDRVVLDPKTKEVTHLIVRKGVFLTHDRVIPISFVSTSEEKRINLTVMAREIDDLPEYEEKAYLPLEESDLPQGSVYYPSFYWYPLLPSAYPVPPMHPVPGMKVETHRNIPDQTVALKAGARVVGNDGEEVGHVVEMFTQTNSDVMTSFVVSRGVLVKEHRMVPMSWVKYVTDEEVQLNVPASRVDALKTFEPAPH